jgi:hypothetical protein
MSTNAKPGIGASLQRWDTSGSSGVWDTISEVFAIDWGGATREVITAFRLNNSDDYVNKLQGTLNGNSVTASIYFTKNQFAELKTDMETRGNINYQIRFPDGEGLEWEGFITELPVALGSDDVMSGEVVIEVDGKPDFVSAWTSAVV